MEQYLPKEKHLGDVDMAGVVVVAKVETAEDKRRNLAILNRPPLDECLSLYDLEVCLYSISFFLTATDEQQVDFCFE